MRKKIVLSVLVVFLVLILAGCGNKEAIKKVIDDYWLALSNRQYELAQTYCIPDGSKYKYAEKLRKEQDPTIKMTFTPCIIKWGWVNAGDAFVSTEMVITATGILGMSATETSPSVEFLDKAGGTWKLK